MRHWPRPARARPNSPLQLLLSPCGLLPESATSGEGLLLLVAVARDGCGTHCRPGSSSSSSFFPLSSSKAGWGAQALDTIPSSARCFAIGFLETPRLSDSHFGRTLRGSWSELTSRQYRWKRMDPVAERSASPNDRLGFFHRTLFPERARGENCMLKSPSGPEGTHKRTTRGYCLPCTGSLLGFM